jgi:NADP-dependent 3-hydroxy acid dehydrogenase YdfG
MAVMDLHLANKVVIVTGASAGIGKATTRLLAQEGATVVGLARSPDGIADLGNG